MLFHFCERHTVAHRVLPPDLNVELTARPGRVSVPESSTKMVDRFGNGLIERLGVDLHFVADPFDIDVTNAAECHNRSLSCSPYVRPMLLATFLLTFSREAARLMFREFSTFPQLAQLTFRYIQVMNKEEALKVTCHSTQSDVAGCSKRPQSAEVAEIRPQPILGKRT